MELKRFTLVLALAAMPLSAFAMPSVGDVVGTNPADATSALEKAGCKVKAFEPEGSRIEAKCAYADGKAWEVYIDPKTGAVAEIKADD